jgi:DNA polymerase I-like protein with 3'-5' exonuclease and polymerase domains
VTLELVKEKKKITKHKFRSMIVAAPGNVLVAADFSQAETWVVAHLACEEKMKQALKFGDIHTQTAAILFYPPTQCDHKWKKNPDDSRECKLCNILIGYDQRHLGKGSNHGNSYRMSPERWTQMINKQSDKPPYVVVTLQQAKAYSTKWREYYTMVPRWWTDLEIELDKNQRTLVTPYGRRRTFYQQWGMELFKEATAFKPQSTVADHANGAIHPELGVKGGFLEVYKQLAKPSNDEIKIINVAHDSIMLECPLGIRDEIAPRVKSILERPMEVNGEVFTIPVDVEYGERWGELEKVS